MAMTREEKNARRRARYAENSDAILEQSAEWRARNPGRFKESSKRSYDKRKAAISAYKKEYYQANAEQEKARASEWYEENRARRLEKDAKTRAWLVGLKAEAGCSGCGLKDPECLDWHHKDPSEKSFNLIDVCRSRVALEREIKKCVVFCANCHRKYHSVEGQRPHQIARELVTAE